MFSEELKSEFKELIESVQILYKFVDYDGAEKIIENGTLLIKNPINFNDPYDCHPKLINYNSIPNQYIKNLINKQYPDISRNERRKKQLEAIKTSKNKLVDFINTDHMEMERNLKGVTCFSKKNLDLLMWSMYADSHKGLCLGFNLEKLFRSLISMNKFDETTILNVKYTNELKPNNYFEDPLKAVVEWLRTKSHEWRYEDEIRIVFSPFQESKGKLGLVSFDLSVIEEIYFGCNVTENNEEKIIDKIKQKGLKSTFYKVSLNENKYKLEVNKKCC